MMERGRKQAGVVRERDLQGECEIVGNGAGEREGYGDPGGRGMVDLLGGGGG